MNKKNFIASLILLGISFLFWVQSKSFTKYGALFPQTVIVILSFLSLLLLISSIIKILSKKSKESKIEKMQDIKSIVISIVLMVAWAFLINIIGFLTSSIVFSLAMYLLLVKRGIKLKKIIIDIFTIILSVMLFYIFFSKGLQVPFPTGILI